MTDLGLGFYSIYIQLSFMLLIWKGTLAHPILVFMF